MKKQKENSHEGITWSEMGKQNVQAEKVYCHQNCVHTNYLAIFGPQKEKIIIIIIFCGIQLMGLQLIMMHKACSVQGMSNLLTSRNFEGWINKGSSQNIRQSVKMKSSLHSNVW